MIHPGKAHGYFLNLDYAAFKVSKLYCNRDYIVPEVECAEWKGAVSMEVDFSTAQVLGTSLFMDNLLHGEGTDAKFKSMGWHYELGLTHSRSGIDLGWEHHSRHALDQEVPILVIGDEERYGKFPVYDAVFLRFTLWGRKVR
jgi:hypothetical protein